VIITLNILELADGIRCDEIDGNTLTSETTGTTDAMEIILKGRWEIEIDDQRHPLKSKFLKMPHKKFQKLQGQIASSDQPPDG